MPFLKTNFKRVPGLSGSGPARLENQENSGPFLAIGGQSSFGSGSGAAGNGGAGPGGGSGACEGDEPTGVPSGGNGGFSNSMAVPDVNNCFPETEHPSSEEDSPYSPPPPCPPGMCCISFGSAPSAPGAPGAPAGPFGPPPVSGPTSYGKGS